MGLYVKRFNHKRSKTISFVKINCVCRNEQPDKRNQKFRLCHFRPSSSTMKMSTQTSNSSSTFEYIRDKHFVGIFISTWWSGIFDLCRSKTCNVLDTVSMDNWFMAYLNYFENQNTVITVIFQPAGFHLLAIATTACEMHVRPKEGGKARSILEIVDVELHSTIHLSICLVFRPVNIIIAMRSSCIFSIFIRCRSYYFSMLFVNAELLSL